MKKRTFLAVILGVLLMSFAAYAAPEPTIYTPTMDPDDVINAVFVSHPDNMTTSKFYITKDWDGYLLYIEANSTHNPYFEKYRGYATEIGGGDEYGLVFHFVVDHDSNNNGYIEDDVFVLWRNYEEIDSPALVGADTNTSYLFNGYYRFEENLAQ